MPIYEYRCKDCQTVFSKLVFNQSVKIECEKCGSDNVEKLISMVSSSSGGSASAGCSGSGFS